jgi:hypothetical protein
MEPADGRPLLERPPTAARGRVAPISSNHEFQPLDRTRSESGAKTHILQRVDRLELRSSNRPI